MCKDWNEAIKRNTTLNDTLVIVQPSKPMKDILELQRLEDRLILAPHVDPQSDDYSHTLFGSHRRILVDWLV